MAQDIRPLLLDIFKKTEDIEGIFAIPKTGNAVFEFPTSSSLSKFESNMKKLLAHVSRTFRSMDKSEFTDLIFTSPDSSIVVVRTENVIIGAILGKDNVQQVSLLKINLKSLMKRVENALLATD